MEDRLLCEEKALGSNPSESILVYAQKKCTWQTYVFSGKNRWQRGREAELHHRLLPDEVVIRTLQL